MPPVIRRYDGVMSSAHRSIPGRCLTWLVGAIDAMLRHVHGITEFETDREGLLRIELVRAEKSVVLSDGIRINPGDMLIELHLWNGQIRPFPSKSVDFGWAVRLRRQTLATLHRLALHMQEDSALTAVRAVRMMPAIARGRSRGALDRLLLKVGFEPVADAVPGHGRLLSFLDNIWLWLLTWAHNPRALKGRSFSRTRRDFWISRSRFLALHAGDDAGEPKAAAAPPASAGSGGPRSGA